MKKPSKNVGTERGAMKASLRAGAGKLTGVHRAQDSKPARVGNRKARIIE